MLRLQPQSQEWYSKPSPVHPNSLMWNVPDGLKVQQRRTFLALCWWLSWFDLCRKRKQLVCIPILHRGQIVSSLPEQLSPYLAQAPMKVRSTSSAAPCCVQSALLVAAHTQTSQSSRKFHSSMLLTFGRLGTGSTGPQGTRNRAWSRFTAI